MQTPSTAARAAQWKKGLTAGNYIGADYELATGENSDSTFFRWPVEVYGAGLVEGRGVSAGG